MRLTDAGQGGPVDVLGRNFYPDWRAVGKRFIDGEIGRKLLEEGTLTVRIANGAGGDGVLHLDRFAILVNGRIKPAPIPTTTPYDGGTYRPGDEWLEVYAEGKRSKPRFVGTPISATVTPESIELVLADGWWLLRKTRETGTGYWRHSPRDAIEHYSQLGQVVLADGFDAGGFTYNNGYQTTADGKWTYRNMESILAGAVSFRGGPISGPGYGGLLLATNGYAFNVGAGAPEPYVTWRMEARVNLENMLFDDLSTGAIRVSLYEQAPHTGNAQIAAVVDGTGQIMVWIGNTAMGITQIPLGTIDYRQVRHLAIEGRGGRWVYVFVNGNMLGVVPLSLFPANVAMVPSIDYGPTRAHVESVLFRRTRPYLMRGADKGDYRLPGAPPADGLMGEYFADVDHKAKAYYTDVILNPTMRGVRRLDRALNWPPTTPAWQPPGMAAAYMSARWTGSVYLDLDAVDYRFRTTIAFNGVRVWIGKTRMGEQIIDKWTTPASSPWTTTSALLKGGGGPLAGQRSGWYPIVIEYRAGASPAELVLECERSDQSGTWRKPGIDGPLLSRFGCLEQEPRADSHYELLGSIARDFGYQLTCEPRSLESGEFPGVLVPRVRQGRDTDKVLALPEARAVQSSITAEDVADALLSDAQGLGTNQDAAQLTAEVVNYAQAAAHLFLAQEYESASEINVLELLLQRLDSMLRLRGGTYEEVQAAPAGESELRDSWPLAGVLSRFAWEPGDAIRLELPSIGVHDLTPRPIMGTSWPFTPLGLGLPSATFRSRVRSDAVTIRQALRTALQEIRNYQGQQHTLVGALGSTIAAIAPDGTTRCSLPVDLSRVVKAELVVLSKGDGSAKNIWVNGFDTGIAITTTGRYPVSRWVAAAAGIDAGMIYATLVGGGSSHTIRLELRVRL